MKMKNAIGICPRPEGRGKDGLRPSPVGFAAAVSGKGPVQLALAAALLASVSALATVPRYTVGGSGEERTVSDGVTGLVWQQQSSGGIMNWKDALDHCEDLGWAGHSDWRLPDVVELSTIVDEKKTEAPAINTVFFAGFEPGAGYWTSTTARQSPSSAYVLYFNEMNATVGRGGTGAINKTATMRALCVRGGAN